MAAAAPIAGAAVLGYIGSFIGIPAGFLGIFNFMEGHIPNVQHPHTVMRIGLALNGPAELEFDGDAPDVRLWNEFAEFLGMSVGDKMPIEDGGFRDVVIEQENTQQPTYAVLSANYDAVCIAYLSFTWPDDQHYGWVGNWGATCDYPWHYANMTIEGKDLTCTWLDYLGGDHGGVTGLQIHLTEFNDKGQGLTNDTDHYCNVKSVMNFRYEEDPNTVFPERRRSVPVMASHDTHLVSPSESNPNPPRHHSTSRRRSESSSGAHLLRSSRVSHSATVLCESQSSRGPDLVSFTEGKFCDMGTKTLWPLCVSEQDADCFNTEASVMRLAVPDGGSDVSVLTLVKSYSKVTDW